MSTVDIRCPVNSRRLFARLLVGDAEIVEGNLIEIACDDCKKAQRTLSGPDVALVLHRYNVLGKHVETEIRRR